MKSSDGFPIAICKDSRCGARIIWAYTAKGRLSCYEAEPGNGPWVLSLNDKGEIVAHHWRESTPLGRETHWAKCVGAKDFRKAKKEDVK